jgi:hypothetical protein
MKMAWGIYPAAWNTECDCVTADVPSADPVQLMFWLQQLLGFRHVLASEGVTRLNYVIIFDLC